jgi:hypothetical protein
MALGITVVAMDHPRMVDLINSAMAEFEWLLPEYRQWFDNHRIEPRLVSLAVTADGSKVEDFWLLTDHNGSDDSSYRIVYDVRNERFGHECLLSSDVPLFLGAFPSLQDALDEIV